MKVLDYLLDVGKKWWGLVNILMRCQEVLGMKDTWEFNFPLHINKQTLPWTPVAPLTNMV